VEFWQKWYGTFAVHYYISRIVLECSHKKESFSHVFDVIRSIVYAYIFISVNER